MNRARTTLHTVAGTLLLLAAMEGVGRLGVLGESWPPLTQVVAALDDPITRDLLGRALAATATAAGTGFVAGTLIALVVALVGALLPPLQPGLDRLAAVVHAVPLIALGPLLITTVGREGTPAVIAALAAGFAVFVAATSGLGAAGAAHRDVFRALGSSRRATLLRLQLPTAVPLLIDGLALAAPAAVLGAVVGEWFGAPRGLGVLLVSSMQNFQTDLMWAAALSAAVISLTAYATLAGLRVAAARRFV
ncbi:ABC-type nitrate/sulfonate/bicarbonate transport system permease component [Streptomyces umbrinus]|uniref:ABC-type nitrate/sulfonate/bicarbonate transport system permease component n=1 Tax=Streptomyces umbrinus TaxID=67370 RepID=A0ABU0TA17_9ACTN|nr:ABC transporter permease subunit [Streptomyces umbrinus]MDQ1032656.1 ABC-type nitrate/sulfonate/bicarbonate transport system permease component [Streptomyces umbrinus]